ncbi:TPA: phage tail tape measure protein [Escherichia coli]|uniref:phage tail tape measure protein n=1 Tax=Citrobacter portucalensis TaxID=1639133 RepID=UPI0018E36AF9|nr:phage tail tape measure protein [Citrobacter portucalensis]MBI1679394.1 phage tail tape measure protein [Citrobacter portucalensis]HCA7860768.1 phage tail tape measure protein [Escherichia coli]HCO0437311.1 phage tail tape measure protein [Escherichia coli]
MAIVNELITKFGFIGNLAPQETFNANLKASIGLLAGMGAAIQGSAGAMAAWFTSIIDGLDPLVQFHRETGLSVEGLQELGRVAELNGSSMEAVTSSIGEMTMRIGEFISTGEGEMADIGKRLGLQFKDASGNVKDATQTFIELSDKMRSMSQAEKFSVLDKMGIDRSMVQMLSLSREELDKSLKQARDWGVVTTEQADAAAEFNNSLKDLRMGYSSVSTQLALSFLPMLKEVIDGMREWLHTNSDLIKNGLHHLGEIIFSVAGMIRRLLPLIGLATAGFVIWKIAAIGLRTVLSTIFSPVLLITAAIVGILLVIDDLVVAMQGGQSVIADFFKDNWGIDIVPGLLAIKDTVMVVVDYIVDVFKQGIENIKLLFSALSKLVTGDFQGAWDDVVKSFTDSVALLRKPFDEFMQWVMGLFANLGETIKNTISNAASNAWNATKSFLGFGEDEQLQGVTGGGNGGMSPDGIPYGMNAAVGIAGGGVTSNSSVSQQNTIHINTSDPVVAGNTAADSLQQNMKDANRLSGRGGR